MRNVNWNQVQESSGAFEAPPAGGYVLAICAIKDVVPREQGKAEYLQCFYDIADAYAPENKKFVGFFGRRKEEKGWELPHFKCYLSDAALGLFKHFLKVIEKSNLRSGFVADRFDNQEQKLVGFVIGAILTNREYWNKNANKIALALDADWKNFHPVEKIMAGDFEVPPCKLYDGPEKEGSTAAPANGNVAPHVPFNEDEIPF